jgi:hypothetical protein
VKRIRIMSTFVLLLLLTQVPPAQAISPSDTHLLANGIALAGCKHLDDFEFVSEEFVKLNQTQRNQQGGRFWAIEFDSLQKAEKAWLQSAQYEPKNQIWQQLAINGKIFSQVKPPPGGFAKSHSTLTSLCKKLKQQAGM